MSVSRFVRLSRFYALLLGVVTALPALAQHPVNNCTSATNLVAEIERTNHIVFTCSGAITVTNPIVITGDVILDGTGRDVTLNGNNVSRIFNVEPGAKLTLINLTLTGGKASQGGAIHNQGTLLATNCLFAGNNAAGPNGTNGVDGVDDSNDPSDGGNGVPGTPGLGGAIWNGSAIVVSKCTFSTNSATGGNGGNGGKGGNGINGSFNSGDGGDGGAGAVGRGGAIFNVNYALINECIFHRNTVTGGNGGTFGAAGTGGLPAKSGSGGAGAVGNGGAVHNTWYVSIRSCTFSENRVDGGNSGNTGAETAGNGQNGSPGAEAWGGAVCNLNTAELVNSTFSTNRVAGGDGAKGANAELQGGKGGNGGTGYGGNYFNNGSSAITNCTFAGGGALGGTNGVGGTGATPGANGTVGANRGGNLARLGGTLALKNTLVCRPGAGLNGFGGIFDMGHNISSDTSIAMNSGSSRVNLAPRIGGLADNDGFGRTFALLDDSPAIDEGDPVDSPEVDQRGFPAFGSARDIGAYEFAASSIFIHIEDVDGNPVSNVQIVVLGSTNLTDGSGNLRLPPLPAGDYTITPRHALYTFDPPSETVTLGPAVDLVFTALRTFSVSGFVRDGTNSVDNVTVNVGSHETDTDTNGFYRVAGLSPGSYTVTPASAGYDFIPGLQQVNVQADTTNVNFTAVGRHSISGRITQNGQGLPDVVVQTTTRSAVTGPTGNYTITEVPQREQVVTPLRTGYSFNPPSFTLVPTADENGIDFTAFQSYEISGVVLNASNSLGANAVTVTLHTNGPPSNPPSPGNTPIVLLTDTNGLFAFRSLPAGSNYLVNVSRPGHGFSLGPPPPPGTPPPPQPIYRLPDSVTNLVYYMFPVFSMSGRVTAGGSSVSNAIVIVRTTNGVEVARMTTSVIGGYSFTNIRAGTYELVPELAGYDFTPTNRIVDLQANAVGLDFTSTGVFSISGAITKGTNGLANVVVRAGSASAVTDVNGRYELSNMTPGTYTVTPDEPRHSFLPLTMSVTVGPSKTNINFQAIDVYTINGEVREGNFPLTGARVVAGGVTNFTGITGRYTLPRVPAGSNVLVVASLPGYQFTPAQQTIVLDSIKNGVDFTARGLSVISGRVIDAVITNNGVGNVKISVAGGRYETNTAANGNYVLTNVGPGVLTVLPSSTNRGFNPISRQITVVTNSHTNNVNFTSFRAFRLSGRVLQDGTTNTGISGVTLRAVGNNATNTVTTDSQGRYSFDILRQGFYTLTAIRAGLGFEPQLVELDLIANTETNFFSFTGFSISGRITDGATGVAGMQVNAGGTTNANFVLPVTTDSLGNYTFSGLRPDDYNIIPVAPGYDLTPAERAVSVGPNAANINFSAQGNLVVAGRVIDGAVGATNIQVRLTSTNNPPPVNRTVTSDASGGFTFSNLPPGVVFVRPVLFDLFTPTNVTIDPFNYPLPTFVANGGILSISRSNTVPKITLRALPGRVYTLQTNNGTGAWIDHRPIRTETNGVIDYLPPNIPSSTILFRSRR